MSETPDNPIFIVPGIASRAFAFTDVMRGEETQIFGLPSEICTGGIACLPGTHSKWVSFQGSRIDYFATFLTGELFASIKSSASIEPVLRCQGFDEAAFRDGVRLSRRPGGLLHHVFSIRSRLVAGEAAHGAHASYLSGLLIGAENMQAYLQHGINGFGIGSSLYKPGKPLLEIKRDAHALTAAYRNSMVASTR